MTIADLLPSAASPGLIALALLFGAPVYMLAAIAYRARLDRDDAIFEGILIGIVVTVAGFFWYVVLPLAAFGGTCKLVVRLASPRRPAPPDPALAEAEREVDRLLSPHPAPMTATPNENRR